MSRIKNCDETYKRLFNKPRKTKNSTDPELINIFERFTYGDVYHTGELDDKTRELITICLLTVQKTPKLIKPHTFAALNVGATPLEIREAVYECAPFIGFPGIMSAVGEINEVFAEKGIEVPLENQATVNEENRLEKGKKIKNELFGDVFEKVFKDLPKGYGEIVDDLVAGFWFGDFYTRGALDVAQRELLMFTVASFVGNSEQIRLHALASQKAGNYKETLIDAMIQSIPYIGFPRAIHAITIIDKTMDY